MASRSPSTELDTYSETQGTSGNVPLVKTSLVRLPNSNSLNASLRVPAGIHAYTTPQLTMYAATLTMSLTGPLVFGIAMAPTTMATPMASVLSDQITVCSDGRSAAQMTMCPMTSRNSPRSINLA